MFISWDKKERKLQKSTKVRVSWNMTFHSVSRSGMRITCKCDKTWLCLEKANSTK